MRTRALTGLAAALVLAAACAGAQTSRTTTAASPLPQGVLTHVEIPTITAKTAAIDIMTIDQAAHLLYVADRTDAGVDVLDVSTPRARYLRTYDLGGTQPNGIVLAPDLHKLFSGNNDSTVTVIDLKSGKAVATLKTGGKNRADELDYDPREKKVYAANSNDGFVTVIDAVHNTIVKKIDRVSDGGLEQPRYDSADGMMYLTLSDDNQVAQFDPMRDVLVRKFDVGVTCNPQGFAINPATGMALLGCGNRKQPQTVLWDMRSMKVVGTFPDAGAGDMTLYSQKPDRFFFAASNFTRNGQPAPELAIFSGSGSVRFLTAVGTAAGSHSVAYDETNQVIYVQDQEDQQAGLFAFPLPR